MPARTAVCTFFYLYIPLFITSLHSPFSFYPFTAPDVIPLTKNFIRQK